MLTNSEFQLDHTSVSGYDFKLPPFAIHKGFKGIAGGDIYLTCILKSQSDNLIKCVLFGDVAPAVVTAHRSLNSLKGG